MNVQETLRRQIDREVFDYQQLMDVLRDYSKPRDKIRALAAAGAVVRVKKGLYVFGESCRRRPIDRGLLANPIYGPSYVSLEYALGYHGLIPERVDAVTSSTTGKLRRFETPFGLFSYRPIPMTAYAAGITQEQSGPDTFLLATPEKALADFVWADRRFRPSAPGDFAAYLHSDLRIEPERLAKLNLNALTAIARAYDTPRITMLAVYLRSARRILE